MNSTVAKIIALTLHITDACLLISVEIRMALTKKKTDAPVRSAMQNHISER